MSCVHVTESRVIITDDPPPPPLGPCNALRMTALSRVLRTDAMSYSPVRPPTSVNPLQAGALWADLDHPLLRAAAAALSPGLLRIGLGGSSRNYVSIMMCTAE